MDTEHDRPLAAPRGVVGTPLFLDGTAAERPGSDEPDEARVTWRVIDTADALADAVRELSAESGPFAVDSERAGGYRYSQRAYLVQVKRGQSENFLIDPIAIDDLSPLAEVLATDEWILHAATQDLPCLTELGLYPPALFDTELAGRLLGREHVGLGAMLEEIFDIHLAKKHSAADWSTRPLPESWLEYAALDVAYLEALRNRLAHDLEAEGKDEWARQEFEYERTAPPKPPRADPWRRTSRITETKSRRGLAVVRELWTVRDQIAQELDKAPGKVLNERAIMAIAAREPLPSSLAGSKSFNAQRPRWEAAYRRALEMPAAELPPRRGPSRESLPDPRNWKNVNPDAAKRLVIVRETMAALSEEHNIPQENLLSPALQRGAAWLDGDVRKVLERTEARPWQIDLVAPALQAALATEAV